MSTKEEKKEIALEAAGEAKAFTLVSNVVNAANMALLTQAKDSKAYKSLGLDWSQYCRQHLGSDPKTINATIEAYKSLGEPFLQTATKLNIKRGALLALNSGLDDDSKASFRKGVVRLGDQEFKLDELNQGINAEEFAEALQSFNKANKENIETLRAEKRVNSNNHKMIDKLHNELEKNSIKKDITEKEADFLSDISAIETSLFGSMAHLDGFSAEALAKSNKPTDVMKARYISALQGLQMNVNKKLAGALEDYGDASMIPGAL